MNSKSYFFLVLFLFLISGNSSSQESQKSIDYGAFLLEHKKLNEAEIVFQELIHQQDGSNLFEIYNEIAKLYNNELYFDLSIAYCQEGINTDKINDEERKRLLKLIAINHLDLKDLNKAEYYYLKSTKINSTNKKVLANDHNLIGEIKRLQHKAEEAIHHFNQAIEINRSLGNTEHLAMNYNNLGLAHLSLNSFEKAEENLITSLRIIDSLGLKHHKMAIAISFGRLYQAQGKCDSALPYFNKIIQYDLTEHQDKTALLRDAHFGLMECYERLGNYRLALEHNKEYERYEKMIFNRETQSSIFENQILNERSVHKKQLSLAKAKAEAEQNFQRTSIALLCVGILLLSLFIFILRLRNKSMHQKVKIGESNLRIKHLETENTKTLNQKLQIEIREKEQLQKVEELELQKLKDAIDFKNRELTSFAIHVSNKNEILTEVNLKIKSLNDWEDSPTLKDLNTLIKQNIQLDKDWEIFKKHFIEVHPRFFESIITKFPELTNDDLKLCAYLKIQLSSKEIGRLLNIEISAVNKRRNRIRKKLDIDSTTNLHEFMLTVDLS
jgi:tetratricopeptide (TPR) repeat protein